MGEVAVADPAVVAGAISLSPRAEGDAAGAGGNVPVAAGGGGVHHVREGLKVVGELAEVLSLRAGLGRVRIRFAQTDVRLRTGEVQQTRVEKFTAVVAHDDMPGSEVCVVNIGLSAPVRMGRARLLAVVFTTAAGWERRRGASRMGGQGGEALGVGTACGGSYGDAPRRRSSGSEAAPGGRNNCWSRDPWCFGPRCCSALLSGSNPVAVRTALAQGWPLSGINRTLLPGGAIGGA